MRASLSLETNDPSMILQALGKRRGWHFISDTMPDAVSHRAWTWRFGQDTTVRFIEDRRFGARGFLFDGAEQDEAERELREFLDFHDPEALFGQVHDDRMDSAARQRALFRTTIYVSAEEHDPAYEQMLARLIEGEDEGLARAAIMISERVLWESLAPVIGERTAHKDPLAAIARRCLEAIEAR